MTGAAFACDFPNEPATTGYAFFWALDVDAFLPREEFLGRMEDQIDQVKAGERLAEYAVHYLAMVYLLFRNSRPAG